MLSNFRLINDRFALSGGWRQMDIASDNFLLDNNIGAVVDLQFTPEQTREIEFVSTSLAKGKIKFHHIHLRDGDKASLDKVLDKALTQIAQIDKNLPKNKRILIKCAAGLSRSVSMLIAYRAYSQGISFLEAREWLWQQELRVRSTPMWSIAPQFEALLKEKFPYQY